MAFFSTLIGAAMMRPSDPPPPCPDLPQRRRADETLVAQGACASRSQARDLILAGRVWADGEQVDKPGRMIRSHAACRIAGEVPFVGRGGEKLLAFLRAYPLPIAGMRALDVGASTGGFTECLLREGVAHVTALDVGRGQLHPKLRADARVVCLEGVDIRKVSGGGLPYRDYPLVVMDLSFISLRLALPAAWRLLAVGGALIALVKPQFEVGRGRLASGGIVRDPDAREAARLGILEFCRRELCGCRVEEWMPSPITGGDGNVEYLIGLRRETTERKPEASSS